MQGPKLGKMCRKAEIRKNKRKEERSCKGTGRGEGSWKGDMKQKKGNCRMGKKLGKAENSDIARGAQRTGLRRETAIGTGKGDYTEYRIKDEKRQMRMHTTESNPWG